QEFGAKTPEEINKREIMEHWGLKGFFGTFRYYKRMLSSWWLQLLASISPHPGLAVKFQRKRGVNIGRHVYIGPNVQIDFLYPNMVTIGDYVSIGMNSMIFAHSNPTCSAYIKKYHYPRSVAPVRICRGAWIPPGSVILAGVTIGENAILGAGSVVTHDIPSYSLAIGAPAKVIRKIEPRWPQLMSHKANPELSS
ncbi:MAG: acyltransferase, partial [Candidatus Hodarchaeota archaeon]